MVNIAKRERVVLVYRLFWADFEKIAKLIFNDENKLKIRKPIG